MHGIFFRQSFKTYAYNFEKDGPPLNEKSIYEIDFFRKRDVAIFLWLLLSC